MPRPILALSLLVACNPGSVDSQAISAARSTAGTAPAIGGDGSEDSADRACNVHLRSAQQVMDDRGDPEVTCEDGVCTHVWRVEVDVANTLVAQGGIGRLTYHRESDAAWREVEGVAGAAQANGYTPFVFVISDHLPGPDSSPESIELIPFAATEDAGRLFDHNVHDGDLDNYWLTPDRQMSLQPDLYVCNHLVDAAALYFTSDWNERVGGDLRVGNALSVSFDLDRLPECRNTHNGYPAWDTTAYVRYQPSGATVSGSVRAIVYDQGRPTNAALSVPLVSTVPAGTTSAEVWFNNASGAGSTCSTWDSNLGANYHFDVKPAPADDPCWGVQTWDSQHASATTCPSYTVSEQQDAGFCELFVDAFGDGYEGHYGIPFRWLEAWITVGPQDGQVLGVGLYTSFRDRSDGTDQERWSFGREVEPGRWKTGLTWQHTGYMGAGPYFYDGGGSYLYDVESFSFFVDVQRRDGHVVRLWQSRRGANYTLDDAFTLATSPWSIPYGNISYANADSGVFDALRACR